MKNIHLMPTDKVTNLYVFEGKLHFSKSPQLVNCRNAYITSDDEIKEGDFIGYPTLKNWVPIKYLGGDIIGTEKKIILTTDQELINDGIQSIDDEFLEWFINNPSCESVEVKKLCQKEVISEWWENLSDEEMKEVFKQTGNFHLGGWGHDIGPTEEDVKDMYLEVHNLDLKKLNFNVYKIIIPKEERTFEDILDEGLSKGKVLLEELRLRNAKRELLADAAYEDCKKSSFNNTSYAAHCMQSFINGANWQAERMYSEEEVILLLQKYRVALSAGETPNLGDTTAQWFNKFKKK